MRSINMYNNKINNIGRYDCQFVLVAIQGAARGWLGCVLMGFKDDRNLHRRPQRDHHARFRTLAPDAIKDRSSLHRASLRSGGGFFVILFIKVSGQPSFPGVQDGLRRSPRAFMTPVSREKRGRGSLLRSQMINTVPAKASASARTMLGS